jgi:hypothetical protein
MRPGIEKSLAAATKKKVKRGETRHTQAQQVLK